MLPLAKLSQQLLLILISIGLSSGCGSDKTHFRSIDDSGGPLAKTSADAAPQYLKTFKAGSLTAANLVIASDFKLIQQDFSLVQAPKTAELAQQINRTVFEDIYVQGNSGTPAQQSFAIAEAGIFDLLIVMDNSSSMSPYQNRFSNNLPSILRYISNTNWRIAVVTTSSACLAKTTDGRRFITRADYDKDPSKTEADFKKLIKIGEGGDPIEKGIKMLADAMTGKGCASESNDWLRPDSQRSILLVSDEKNCGSGPNEGCPGAAWETADYFFDRVGYNIPINAFLLLQEPPNVDASNPSDPNRDCEGSGGYENLPNPTEYKRLVASTGGISNDICRANYATVLEQISLDVRKKINIQFELTYPAVATSLDILIDDKQVSNFTVSGKTLTILENVSDRAKNISVSYKHDPIAMVRSFLPNHTPDGKTFEVYINNEKLASSLYHFDSNSNRLELHNIPPESAVIKTKYREGVQLRKVFTYSAAFVADSLEVWVDNSKTKDYILDPSTKRVTFLQAPNDGQSISLRYELAGDRKLSYTILAADATRIENVKLIDLADSKELSSSVVNGKLVLENDDVYNGRKVRAIYNMSYDFKDKVYSIKTSAPPFPGTLSIDAEGDKKVCNHDLEIHEDKLQFSCTDEDFETIAINYSFADDYKNSFDLSVDYSGPKTYKVYIDGQELSSYQILENQLVILKKHLPAGSEVKVIIQAK